MIRSHRRASGPAHPRGLLLAMGMAGLAAGPIGRAESPADRAKALFDEGKAALEAGQAAEACTKFAESQALLAGVGTLANLARCHEQQGLLVEALDYWQQTQRLADRTKDPRRELAAERTTSLVQRIPTLTILLAERAPRAVRVGVTDVRSSQTTELRPEQLGVPRRVNPGTQRVVVEAPGREPRAYEVDLVEGARERLEVDVAPSAGPAEPDRGGGKGEAPTEGRVADGDAGGVSGWTVGGIVTGALGIVGLGVGAAFAGIASSKNAESNETDTTGTAPCDAEGYCNDAGMTLRDEAIDAANVSTALFVVGGVLAAGGLLMIILAPSDGEPDEATTSAMQWQLGIGVGQLTVRGTF